MNVVFSRKGFDSSYGGIPSPILPDGTLLSLPIPSDDIIKFENLKYHGKSYLNIIKELKPNYKQALTCHLDPDIRKDALPRKQGWKPSFGQVSSAMSHLDNQGITIDDIFLFFGWFRQTEYNEYGTLQYVKNAPDVQLIYSYFQIGETIRNPQKNTVPNWLTEHPHVGWLAKNNTIFIAKDQLTLNPQKKGAEVLTFSQNLVLTKYGHTRRYWNLPDFFRKIDITYHSKDSWKNDYFESACKGQEFVFKSNNDVENWLINILLK